MDNPFEITAPGATATAAAPATASFSTVGPPPNLQADPLDMFPTIDASEYDEYLGGTAEPLVPGDYVFHVADLIGSKTKPGSYSIQLKVKKVLSTAPGVPTESIPKEGATIFDNFNNLARPSGTDEKALKGHRISFGRFKGIIRLATGEELTGLVGGLRPIKEKLIAGGDFVGRVQWSTRPPKGSSEKSKRITYSEWLVSGKPDVFDNVTSYRAAKPEELA